MVVSNWAQMNRVLHLILYGEKLTCKDDVNPGDKQVSSLGIHCCFSSKSLL